MKGHCTFEKVGNGFIVVNGDTKFAVEGDTAKLITFIVTSVLTDVRGKQAVSGNFSFELTLSTIKQ
jgi:hypothetical protein